MILKFNQFLKESITHQQDVVSDTKGSKILDKNGKLLFVYKSAGNKTFESNVPETSGYFTTSKKAALGFGKDIDKYVLYLENPLIMTNYGLDDSAPDNWYHWLEVKQYYFDNCEDPYKKIQEDGYDGIIELNDKQLFHDSPFDEMLNPNRVLAFNPDSIKKIGGVRWYEVHDSIKDS